MRAFLSGGGRYDHPTERLPILKQALTQTSSTPRLLVIPTPLKWPPFDEVDSIRATLDQLKVNYETLTPDTQTQPSYAAAAELIHWANAILILGGNYAEQMKRWQSTGINQLLIAAATTDKIFVGGSTGLLCWFQSGHTNTHPLDYSGPPHSGYRFEPGLGVLPTTACAHYDGFHAGTGAPRAASFRTMMLRRPIGSVGIGVTTHATIQIESDTVRLLGDRYASVHHVECTPAGLHNREYHPSESHTIPFDELFGNTQ